MLHLALWDRRTCLYLTKLFPPHLHRCCDTDQLVCTNLVLFLQMADELKILSRKYAHRLGSQRLMGVPNGNQSGTQKIRIFEECSPATLGFWEPKQTNKNSNPSGARGDHPTVVVIF